MIIATRWAPLPFPPNIHGCTKAQLLEWAEWNWSHWRSVSETSDGDSWWILLEWAAYDDLRGPIQRELPLEETS